jgi:hypothetical protein
MQMKLLIQGATATADREPDRSLLRLIGQARRFNEMVMNGHSAGPPSAGRKTITELANQAGVSPSYFTRVFRLSFLAPEISKTILHGLQPTTLTAKSLMLPRETRTRVVQAAGPTGASLTRQARRNARRRSKLGERRFLAAAFGVTAAPSGRNRTTKKCVRDFAAGRRREPAP